MSMLKVDLELVKKYNVPGPRYTSYPPATHFTNEIAPEAFVEEIRSNNQTDRDLSLYFHLPFCYSLCWFCGCTTVITADQKKSAEYVKYLEREMDLMKPLLNPKRKVVQLHFGGGTPTFLLPDEIRRLGEMIHSRFTFAPDIEAGVEVDPRRLTRDHLIALRDVGFNRGSMGVQDDDPVVQKTVHRIQPFEMTRQVVEWMHEVGFHSVNIDLIYGLPYQTPSSFAKTLDEILTLKPDRFAVFNYAHVPWMKPAQKILKPEILPSPETKLELLKLTIERLTSEGYVYIGMDHFAHAGRGGHLRVWDVIHLAGGRVLLAEPEGTAGLLRGAGCGQAALAPRLRHDRRGQAPPHHDHASDVRPRFGLCGHVEAARARLQRALRA
jgi:oxygen-independent coproporphyrinogen-3 oxidase